MSHINYDILQDAPKSESTTCCGGCFNKRQMKHFAVMWIAGLAVITLLVLIPYLSFRLLPSPKTAKEAGLLRFSEERYVPSALYTREHSKRNVLLRFQRDNRVLPPLGRRITAIFCSHLPVSF